jgi:hypothetical protein
MDLDLDGDVRYHFLLMKVAVKSVAWWWEVKNCVFA